MGVSMEKQNWLLYNSTYPLSPNQLSSFISYRSLLIISFFFLMWIHTGFKSKRISFHTLQAAASSVPSLIPSLTRTVRKALKGGFFQVKSIRSRREKSMFIAHVTIFSSPISTGSTNGSSLRNLWTLSSLIWKKMILLGPLKKKIDWILRNWTWHSCYLLNALII